LLLAVPQMYGVGYPVLQRAVAGQYVVGLLIAFMAAKVLATSLTMWIGGSGGVFAPSLFMGAMLGSAYGAVVHRLLPHLAAASGAYGLVGMAAVFASAARAPITAVIIVFELTGDYNVILPLMFSVVVATALSNRITRDTIYTLKLRRRGVDIDAMRSTNLMRQITVADAMGRPPRALVPDQPLSELIDRFAAERSDSLPVIDHDQKLVGIVAAGDIERAIARDLTGGPRVAATLAREAPVLRAGESLEDAVLALGAADDEGVPVLSDEGRVVGWITHRRLLRAYRQRLSDQSGTRRNGAVDRGRP
jgi:CIC family chloride channel protein